MPLSVATTCPSCGGSLEFEHGSNAVRCGYCGSSHVVTGHGRALSYYIPEKIDPNHAAGLALAKLAPRGESWRPREATLFFVPFHHFTGQDLSWEAREEVISEGGNDEDRLFRAAPFGSGGFGSSLDDFGEASGHGTPRLTEKRFELATRHIDRTLPALDVPGLNVCSLGLRPEVIKLSLFEKEAVLKRGLLSPLGNGGEDIERRGYAPARQGEIVARKVIGRTRSLIHFPFWVVEAEADGGQSAIAVLDGVSGDVTNADAPPALLDRLVAKDGNHFETVGLRPLKCPECAADLPVRQRDVLFFCGSCGQAWYISGTELNRVPYSVIPRGKTGNDMEYLPFWFIQARVLSGSGEISSKYDLTRLAPGLRVPQEEDKKIPLRFFVPAFEIGNLNILSRLAAGFTRAQPVWPAGRPPEGLAPTRGCFISPEDALELAPLILFTLVPKGNKRALAFALESKVEVRDAGLVLVPFSRTRLDYVDELLGLAVPVAALRN